MKSPTALLKISNSDTVAGTTTSPRMSVGSLTISSGCIGVDIYMFEGLWAISTQRHVGNNKFSGRKVQRENVSKLEMHLEYQTFSLYSRRDILILVCLLKRAGLSFHVSIEHFNIQMNCTRDLILRALRNPCLLLGINSERSGSSLVWKEKGEKTYFLIGEGLWDRLSAVRLKGRESSFSRGWRWLWWVLFRNRI